MSKYEYWFGRYKESSKNKPAFSDLESRFRHLYIIGQSGMGKSTAMENLAQHDIGAGYSVIYIDPKGESAQKLYYHNRDNDKVRYVSFDNPISVNLLAKKSVDFDALVDEFVQILDNVITITSSNPESSVRMREVVYQALASLQEEDRDFETLYKFLNSTDFRKDYNYTNPDLRKWWDDLFHSKKTGYKKRTDYELTMSSVASRIYQALRNQKVNAFIEGEHELDIEKLVNEGSSLLVNVKSSNEFIKVFISNLFVSQILSYIISEKKVKPLLVYIDEFDLVVSGMFADTLQLGRSSFVSFTLAHQSFSSAKSENHRRMMMGIIDSIFGAVSNYLVFNTSSKVSKTMVDVFNLKLPDFLELDRFEARLKLGLSKTYIYTKKPVLCEVPDDFEFPSKNAKILAKISFLDDSWIMM